MMIARGRAQSLPGGWHRLSSRLVQNQQHHAFEQVKEVLMKG